MTALVFIALMAFSVVLAFMAKRGVIANSMDDVMVAGRSFGAFMVFFVTVGETYGIGTMIGVPPFTFIHSPFRAPSTPRASAIRCGSSAISCSASW